MPDDFPPLPLPEGIRARFIETETGLSQHVLEAGEPDRPLLLLLHGFPELAFSWRRVMIPLAETGYRVVAPDQRGFGRTTGCAGGYDDDLTAFSMSNVVRDAVALVRALGRETVHCVIGHDYGSSVAAWSALIRPDVFPRLVCISTPFGGPPAIREPSDAAHEDMLALSPPRKHYQWYYATRAAAPDMESAPEGLENFLRAYFHMKSADWSGNDPHRLQGWRADQLALMPTYYVMEADQTMPDAVRAAMPTDAEIDACRWMPREAMMVYAREYGRTGFQGALNGYRCRTSPRFRRDLSVLHGRRIEAPTMFIAGRQDWGWAQAPGALEAMETRATTDWRGTVLIDGAGHWAQQEQPETVVAHVREFLAGA